MLRDILAEMLAREPGMEVLDGPAGSLVEAVRTVSPDVLVLSAETHEHAGDFIGLLCERPVLRVVTIAEDARSAAIHTLRLDTSVVHELSLDGLLAVLRRSAASQATADRARSGM